MSTDQAQPSTTPEALAEEVRRSSGLQLKAVTLNGAQWLYFPDQWDPKFYPCR